MYYYLILFDPDWLKKTTFLYILKYKYKYEDDSLQNILLLSQYKHADV